MTVPETKKETWISRLQKKNAQRIHDVCLIVKTAFYVAVATLMFFGVCYLKNWSIQIVQHVEQVKIISPIAE